MLKKALVLRHVQFEDLGHFRKPLEYAGYEIVYGDLIDDDFCRTDPLEPDLMLVLGGPVGVYEAEVYPFLSREADFIGARVKAGRPTLGVCLGAQLIAASLGAAGPKGAAAASRWHRSPALARRHLRASERCCEPRVNRPDRTAGLCFRPQYPRSPVSS